MNIALRVAEKIQLRRWITPVLEFGLAGFLLGVASPIQLGRETTLIVAGMCIGYGIFSIVLNYRITPAFKEAVSKWREVAMARTRTEPTPEEIEAFKGAFTQMVKAAIADFNATSQEHEIIDANVDHSGDIPAISFGVAKSTKH